MKGESGATRRHERVGRSRKSRGEATERLRGQILPPLPYLLPAPPYNFFIP